MKTCHWCGEIIWGNTYYTQDVTMYNGDQFVSFKGGVLCSEKCYREWHASERADFDAGVEREKQNAIANADTRPGGRNCTTCDHFRKCCSSQFLVNRSDRPRFTEFPKYGDCSMSNRFAKYAPDSQESVTYYRQFGGA